MPASSQHVQAVRNARRRSELLDSLEVEYSIYFQDIRNMERKVKDYFGDTITWFLMVVVIFLGGCAAYLLITKTQELPLGPTVAWALIFMCIGWFRFYIVIQPTKKDYANHKKALQMKADVKWEKIMKTFGDAGVGGVF